MIEVSWLWRNREKILSSLKSSGKSEGQRDILDKMANVQQNKSSSSAESNRPQNDGEFNPQKFITIK